MGPEGGDGGGEVVAQGTPEQILKNPRSHTAAYLRAGRQRIPQSGRRWREAPDEGSAP